LKLYELQLPQFVVFGLAEAKGCINPNAPCGGSLAFNASQGRCALTTSFLIDNLVY